MDIKNMISKLLGFEFNMQISECEHSGVYVKYDGTKAVIGGCSIPAKARAYTLLAKGISQGEKNFEISQQASFDTLGVMLDMSRGGVMKVESVKKYLKYMAAHGMNMLMLYTEDTYEVKKYPYLGYQRGRGGNCIQNNSKRLWYNTEYCARRRNRRQQIYSAKHNNA